MGGRRGPQQAAGQFYNPIEVRQEPVVEGGIHGHQKG